MGIVGAEIADEYVASERASNPNSGASPRSDASGRASPSSDLVSEPPSAVPMLDLRALQQQMADAGEAPAARGEGREGGGGGGGGDARAATTGRGGGAADL